MLLSCGEISTGAFYCSCHSKLRCTNDQDQYAFNILNRYNSNNVSGAAFSKNRLMFKLPPPPPAIVADNTSTVPNVIFYIYLMSTQKYEEICMLLQSIYNCCLILEQISVTDLY
jgi:hypothetical protein